MSALLLPNQFMKDSLTFSCLVSILKLCYSLYSYPILEMRKKSAIVYMCVQKQGNRWAWVSVKKIIIVPSCVEEWNKRNQLNVSVAQVGSVRTEGCRIFLVQRSAIVVVYPPPDAFDSPKHLWLGTDMQGLTAHGLCSGCRGWVVLLRLLQRASFFVPCFLCP